MAMGAAGGCMWLTAKSIEDESQELLRLADGILAILGAQVPRSSQREHRAMEQVARLRGQWRIHLDSLARAAVWIRSQDRHFTSFLDRFELEAAVAFKRLEGLDESAGPGNSRSDRVRAAIAETLRVIAREQMTVIPLMRRWSSPRQAASAFGVTQGGPQSGPILPF